MLTKENADNVNIDIKRESYKEGISVIIPIYNSEQYLGKCLDSIFNQTRKAEEVICVDDGSTDSSLTILRDYTKDHSEIRIIAQKHSGLVRARKTGSEAAGYEWSVYVDSDDWLEPDFLEKLAAIEESSDADIVQCGYYSDYGDGNTVSVIDNFNEGLYQGEDYRVNILNQLINTDRFYSTNLELHVWSRLYKTKLLYECQMLVPDDCTIGEDIALSMYVLLKGKSIYVSHYTGYHYFKNPNSMMGRWKGLEEQDRRNIKVLSSSLYDAVIRYGENESIFLKQIKLMLWYVRLLRLDDCKRLSKDRFIFPFGDLSGKERIILYGNGKTGRHLQRFIKEINKFQVIGIADSYSRSENVIGIDDIKKYDYDAVLITIFNHQIAEDAFRKLLERGISKDKIFLPDADILLRTEFPE